MSLWLIKQDWQVTKGNFYVPNIGPNIVEINGPDNAKSKKNHVVLIKIVIHISHKY